MPSNLIKITNITEHLFYPSFLSDHLLDSSHQLAFVRQRLLVLIQRTGLLFHQAAFELDPLQLKSTVLETFQTLNFAKLIQFLRLECLELCPAPFAVHNYLFVFYEFAGQLTFLALLDLHLN